MAKVVAITNFKGGVGKSTISRTLALLLVENCKMISFDVKRDARNYSNENIIQMNMEVDETAINTKKGLLISKREYLDKTNPKSGYEIKSSTLPYREDETIILDFGGTYDTRLPQSNADLFIIPTSGDKESLHESIRTAQFIRINKPEANILFIYNQFLARGKSTIEKEFFIIRETINKNGYEKSKLITIPFSEFFSQLTTKKKSISSLVKNAGAWYNYKTKFEPKMNEIIDEIKGV